MPTALVNGITWNYTLDLSNNASIGTGTAAARNATTLSTGPSGAITIPSELNGYTVKSIGRSAFELCSNMTSVTIPNSVTSISSSSFGQSGLTSVTIPNLVMIIGNGAFDSCIALATVTIPNSVTTIGDYAFYGCTGLTSLTIGNSVATIGSYGFYGCNKITSVTIPNTVTSIGSGIFWDCTKLTSINIPDSVTSIGTDAFLNTSALLIVTIKNNRTISNVTFTSPTAPGPDITFFGNTSVTLVLPPPTMTITSTTAGVTNNATTKNETIELTFTSSASTTNFVVEDISLTNGALSAFTGSGTVYTAIFTPAGQGACTISVAANKFTSTGQNNTASNTFNWTFDTVSPSMTITSTTTGVASGSTTNNAFIELRFASTDSTNNFVVGDISVTNGTLSNFAGSGTIYTAIFTPTSPGLCTIGVLQGVYTDEATNLNNLATQFNWTFDSDYGIPKISWTSPTETILRASDRAAGDWFGYSTAISGNYAIVGANYESGASNNIDQCGAAYIFERDGSGNWTEKKILRASNLGASDEFGYSVAISGNYAIVGAYSEDASNASATFNCGAAYIFERDSSGNWAEKQILRANNLGSNHQFGWSVAISGNYAIVGANQENNSGNMTASGAAYIFEIDGSGNWIQKPILRASNVADTDRFGESVAISGNYAIVGAYSEDGTSNQYVNSGAAYIFERDGSGNWIQTQLLRANNIQSLDQFGITVAISGNYAIIGATAEDGTSIDTNFDCGAAYIFERDGAGNWIQTTILRASNLGATNYFGTAVAISGNYAIVGTPYEDGSNTNPNTSSGAAYIFERIAGVWTEIRILRASNIDANDQFGYSVAISGDYVIAGARYEAGPGNATGGSGAAYIYRGSVLYTPTQLSFVNNALTITNSIDATDTDVVSFPLTTGNKLYPFSVTSFTGTGTVSYSLDISGGANIKTGTFSANNFDLLTGTAVTASVNTTYILTLTANAAITYTIVGLLDYGIKTNNIWASPTETLIRASNFEAGDNFGLTVAISGNYAIVGAPFEDGSSTTTTFNNGAAYIFERDNSGMMIEKILRASNLDENDQFGTSVAISGNYAIVGAHHEDGSGNEYYFSGAAYIFERDSSGNWTEKTILRASNIGSGDYFGYSVAISGNYAIVGAYSEDDNNDSKRDSGAAYIFERISGNWIETKLLRASDVVTYAEFGYSVAISGNYAIVGAPGGAINFTGSAYIFERNDSGNWIQHPVILKASNFGYDQFGQSDRFGERVAISGNYAIIGAWSEDGSSNQLSNCGAAYIFERNGSGNWTEKSLLRASNLEANDRFGQSVAISGNYAIVGANLEDGTNTRYGINFNSGAAYMFERDGSGNWAETKILRANNDRGATNFGESVAIDGNYAIVGASQDPGSSNYEYFGSGSAYIYKATVVDPTPVTFVDNTFTISNGIDAADTDAVSFSLTGGSSLYPFSVTGFSGNGTISYSLAISGGASVKTGIFSGANFDLLAGTALTASGYTTYILTLTANAEITYTIVGSILTPPTNIALSNNSVNELQPVGTTIGTLSCNNPNASLITYSVSDTTRFSITGSTLKTSAIFDFETASSYVVTITASIAGVTSSNSMTIFVTNISGEAAELRRQNLQGAALKTVADSQGIPITATELRDVGYNLIELKSAVYNATQLKAAAFTATELKDVSFNAIDLKTALFTATELKDASFNVIQLKDASFNATELKTALFTATELKDASFNVIQLKDASFNATELKTALFTANELKDASFNLIQLKDASFTATELKDASFNAIQLKDALFTATELKTALFTATELKDASFNVIQLKDASFNATELKTALFTATELKTALFTASELKDASFNATELKIAAYTATEMKSSYSLPELIAGAYNPTELKAAAYTVADLTSSFSLAELKSGGYTATEMKSSYSLPELIAGAYNPTELKDAAYTVADLTSSFSLAELKTGGYTATEMKSSYSLPELIAGAYNPTELKAAAYTVADLTSSFSLESLKTGGYTAAEMKSSFPLAQLIGGGYNSTELKAAAYTVAEMASNGISIESLKTGGYTVPEMTSKFSFAQLKTGGFTAAEMKTSYSLNSLITGGYNATELKAAAYTAAELKSKFTLEQLKIGGYTATEMKIANFPLAQLKASGYTLPQMTSSYTLAELKAGGYTATEISSVYSLEQLIDAGYNSAELKAAGYTVTNLKSKGFSLESLKTGGYTAAEMKSSYTLGDLVDGGYAAAELKAAAYTVADLTSSFSLESLKTGGYTAAEMKSSFSLDQLIGGGYNALDLKAAAYTVTDLTVKGFSIEQLKSGGYTPTEMISGYSFTDLKTGGYTAAEMKSSYSLDELIGGGYTAVDLKSAAYTVSDLTAKNFTFATLKSGGYTATEMDAIYSLDQLIDGGYTAGELKSAAYTAADLIEKGFGLSTLKAGGYTAIEMKSIYSLDDFISGGYNATELRSAAYNVADLNVKGFDLATLKAGGYTVAEMISVFSFAQLKSGGYSAAEMKAAGYSLADLKTGGYNAAELKSAEFTASQLKNANFTIDELKTGGYTAAQMKVADYNATELKTIGYTAAQMKDALYSAAELNSLGYTPLQLVDGGFNSASLLISGIMPDWNVIENANCITTSYVQDFIDVSGSIILRENANLYVNGNVEIGGDLLLNRLVLTGDANFSRSIFVGSDVSMNGKLTARGDLSMNGTVTKCSFNNSSIPKSAFAAAVPDGPNYTTTRIVYDQTFQSNADVSMNGTTVAANNVKVSGNIIFGDGTVMNAYDNNVLIASPKVFNASTFTRLDICGNLVAGSYATSSDYRIKTNIVELDETYTVDKLRPVKYYQTQINREKYGLIAHELQEHYPDLVVGEKDGSELQRINYMGLIAILINDIKRLKLELTEIETNVVIG